MNEQNLKPFTSEQSREEAVKNGRKGGVASGEAKRRNKTIAELSQMMLNLRLSEKNAAAIKKLVPDINDEDMTTAAAMVAGQISSAIKGNTTAFLAVNEQAEKARTKEEAERKRRETYHMDLENVPDNFHALIRDIRRHDHQQYILYGGRGSMKSSTAAMVLLEILKNNRDVHALVMRQVGNTLKDSVYSKLKWAIDKQGLEDEFTIAPEFGYIGVLWFEELDQFGGEEAVRKIEQSAIRGGDDAWIIKTFNPPISRNNWANKYAMEPSEFKLAHRSAYTDLGIEKEWLGAAFIQEAEHLKETNPTAYAHEYGGEAVGIGAEIFPFLEIRTITDEEISEQERIYQGQDWGWSPDPKAFVRLSYNHAKETVMLIDELGGTCIRTKDFAQMIIDKGYSDFEIRCGVDEPEHINDYRDMGLAARKAVVTPGSVRRTHEWLQCRKIIIDPTRTPNSYREFTEYEHDVDRNGEVIDGYPDRDNHYIDAVRYATSPLSMGRGNSA